LTWLLFNLDGGRFQTLTANHSRLKDMPGLDSKEEKKEKEESRVPVT
jgi:hypothetical protein